MSFLRKKYDIDLDESDSEESNQINDIIKDFVCEKNIQSESITNKKIKKNQIKSDIELLDEYNGILKQYWGYDGLKPTQFEIIKKVVEENSDVCAILATGFGKSICYQLPYLITKKNVIVISPLIALMYEQGQEMLSKGIPTAVFNSDTTIKIKNDEKMEISNGTNKLIFMTPEFFIKSEEFIKSIKDQIAMISIDEAHAVSTWGLDFRPGYTELKIIKSWLPQVPILTLTATASTKVREDIYRILRLDNPELVVGNFDRPNLLIRVLKRTDSVINDIDDLMDKYPDEYVIIYCKTRDETYKLAEKLRELGKSAESYHGGMSDKIKKKVQQDFINGTNKCICATIAFGMGINIPNVRLVIHYNCPKNMESYYQEIGRAGRDGKASECVLFYSTKDFQVSRLLIKDMSNPIQKLYQENQIRQIEKYVETRVCRRRLILENFGQTILSCSNCDNCIRAVNTKKEDINYIDYTCPIYLILNVLAKTNGKFGLGMNLYVLLGKQSKVKDWMTNWDEYGMGESYGNENWWKEFSRYLINQDYIIETQAPGKFFSTVNLTEKGIQLKNKLNQKYFNYQNLIADSNEKSTNYKSIQIILEKIHRDDGKTIKKKSNTKSNIKNTIKINKDITLENNSDSEKSNKQVNKTKKILKKNISSYRKNLSQMLNQK